MSPTVPPISVITTSASQLCRGVAHPLVDLVGDVGDELDGLAEVVAPALLADDVLEDLAAGQVVEAVRGAVWVKRS